jgi:DNA replication protein DnaC
VLYTRASRLLQELHVAHGDGSSTKRLAKLASLDLLLIDDLALSPITASERSDLLEVLDDRVGTESALLNTAGVGLSKVDATSICAW